MRRLIWIPIALGCAALIWWVGRPKPIAVDVARVSRGPVRAMLQEQARTQAKEIFVVSAPVAGRLMRIDLNVGDEVKASERVAEIDPLPIQSRADELNARIQALRSRVEGVSTKKPKREEVERAKVLEDTARRNFDAAEEEERELQTLLEHATAELSRTRILARRKAVTPAKLDTAQTIETQARRRLLAHQARMRVLELRISIAELERSMIEARQQDFDWEEEVYRAQIAGLEATLRSIAADLGRTMIKSPIAGTVLTIHKESEQVVLAGDPILELADLSHLEVEVEFLSEDASHMAAGMEAEVFGRALGERVLRGRIIRIEPRAFVKISSLGVEQQRVRVIVAIDEKDTGLRDRFRVQVRVILRVQEEALRVPEGALFREGGSWHVFRLTDGRAERVRVETGIRDVRSREVLSGLAEDDQVILYPGESLEEGDRVEPLPGRTVERK